MISRGGFIIAVTAALIAGISLGVIGGFLSVRYVMHNWAPPFMERHGPPRPGEPPPGVLRLERALDLTPAQRDSIDAVVSRSRGRFEALRDSLRREIDAQLTPAQRENWHKMEERFPHSRRSWPRHGDRP